MVSIIFVCTANMCRSAIAEGIFRKRLHDLNRDDIMVSSMGTHGIAGAPATEYAISVCAENQIDISRHISRPLVPEELVGSRMIFVMEPVQKEFIHLFFPRVEDRTFLLGAWPAKETRKAIIHDPVGQKINEFRKTFSIISSHINRIIPLLLD
ncbi:MAG: hypothetical protein GX640_07455 [Fibrobacter sp.]|nr:hypothetical protein [Fibrobacter sp.]